MNNLWRLSSRLLELRIQFCQTSPQSAILRNFVVNKYPEIKKLNPRLPILIRESSGVSPRVVARYDFGVEKALNVGDLDENSLHSSIIDLLANPPHLQPPKIPTPSKPANKKSL